MSWDEIGRGLTSMGVALGELVASLSVLDKLGGSVTCTENAATASETEISKG